MNVVSFSRRALRQIKVIFANFLIQVGILDRFVLIRMDGGFCSQMHFYMIGHFFEAKGYRVKYTLEWYRIKGTDMNGNEVRNFDLLKAFPGIQLKVTNRIETFLYGVFSYHNDFHDSLSLNKWLELHPPVYLKGYYNTPKEWYLGFRSLFKVNYELFDDANKAVYNDIQGQKESVAVHVRLGDLASFLPAYGEPASTSYFKKAILYIEQSKGSCFLFFFSNEPEKVSTWLIPELGLKNNYRIVDINGADKGYFDTFLISSCKNQITSKGSLGKYGGFLCKDPNSIITVVDDASERNVWEGADSRIVFIK